MTTPASLCAIVQSFFQQHLVGERNLSPNTVLSYRDTMRQILDYLSRALGRPPDRLALADFDASRVRAFLDGIERDRNCSPRSRNQRLAAIKTFFRYVASVAPEHLERCRQIREVPAKRVPHRAVRYLEQDEMEAILAVPDLSSPDGLRNRMLLTLAYNTGARVQEMVDLDVAALRITASPKVRLMGKGGRERDCPLWTQTVDLLRRWLKQRGLAEGAKAPLLVNARGQRLTRHGIAYILKRAADRARLRPDATRPKNITPHTIRHTTAMQLLRSGVDMTVIAAWLGHADLRTTHTYVEIDLRMKQAAIAGTVTVLPESLDAGDLAPSLIAWLDALGRGQRHVESGTAAPRQGSLAAGCST